ncbi:hypothetical protein B0H21DRAFT_455521 [Amylocystis lapponica]|nr:hypothetical protein B0H21DRAFT_455521 [Amylocystis lapponica]
MMHKLRRKKSSQDISSTAVAAAVAAAARPSDSSATATPLYARFAIGHKHSDAAAATAKAVVSEPMALGGAGRARREVGARRERSTRQRKDSGASGDRDSVRAPSRTAAVGPMHVNAPENRQLASSSASAYARARAQSASSGSPAGAREGLQQKSASSLKAAPLPVRSSGESAPPTPPKHPSPGAVLKSSPRRVRPPYLPDDTPTPSLSSASAYASTLGRPYNASATPPHKRPPGSDNKTSSPALDRRTRWKALRRRCSRPHHFPPSLKATH